MDLDLHKEMVDHASKLVSTHSKRNDMFKALEDIVLMRWSEKAEVEAKMHGAKITISPTGAVKLGGYIRLLGTTDPYYSIPADKNDTKANDVSSKLEAYIRVAMKSLDHLEMLRSAALYGEVQIGMSSTRDVLALMEKNKASKAQIARVKRKATMTPFPMKVYNPTTGYPEWDDYGLRSFYREVECPTSVIAERYGKDAVLGVSTDTSTLCEWWDLEWYAVCIKGHDPIKQIKHELPFIPVICHLVEGSLLFDAPDEQRNPFLSTMLKSGGWKRENLALTAWYTQLFQYGASPQLKYNSAAGEDAPAPTFDVLMGVLKLEPGADIKPMLNQDMIPDRLIDAYKLAHGMNEESTLYSQALGQPMSSGSAYATVSLMSQAGRLPLVIAQKSGQEVLGKCAEMLLDWTRLEPGSHRVCHAMVVAELDAKDVPENVTVNCKLDVALPQDKMQNASIVKMIVDGGITDLAWAQENIMNISNPDEMRRRVWNERTANAMQAAYVQAQVQKFMLSMQPPPPQGMGGSPGAPPPQEPGPEPSGPRSEKAPMESMVNDMQNQNPEMPVGEGGEMPSEYQLRLQREGNKVY